MGQPHEPLSTSVEDGTHTHAARQAVWVFLRPAMIDAHPALEVFVSAHVSSARHAPYTKRTP